MFCFSSSHLSNEVINQIFAVIWYSVIFYVQLSMFINVHLSVWFPDLHFYNIVNFVQFWMYSIFESASNSMHVFLFICFEVVKKLWTCINWPASLAISFTSSTIFSAVSTTFSLSSMTSYNHCKLGLHTKLGSQQPFLKVTVGLHPRRIAPMKLKRFYDAYIRVG